jgi:hypothetical protein
MYEWNFSGCSVINTDFFNPILFAVFVQLANKRGLKKIFYLQSVPVHSANCIKTYTVACRGVLSSASL